MTIPADIVPVLSSVSAAIIAGAIVFVVAVLSKELKTSEFRQAWIDGLRTDISEMVASAQMLAHAVTAKKDYGQDASKIVDFLYEKHEDFVAIRTRHNRIVLRLNPKEHSKLIAAVDGLAGLAPLSTTDEEIFKSVQEILKESQVVLKTEWERVKRGETVFRWTLRVSLAVVVVSLVIGSLYASDHLLFQYVP